MPVLFLFTFFLVSCSGGQLQKPPVLKPADSAFSVKPSNRFDTIISHNYSYRNLSDQFALRVHFKSYHNTTDIYDSAVVSVIISGNYNPELFDTLFLTALYYADSFQDSNRVVSYSTKVNTNKQIVDNYFGDIVIADLNFDNLDDIAVVSDAGGNGGPLYAYYLQNSERKFLRDTFLTDSVMFFPTVINRRRQTLTTLVHAGACCVGKTVYYFDNTNKRWIEKSHIILQ